MIDVLLCVGPNDIDHLFLHSLTSCALNLRPLRQITVVTPNRARVLERLALAGQSPVPITVLEDHELLAPKVAQLPGWSRQQAIKLAADRICNTRFVACLGADTILLQKVEASHLIDDGEAILYYNRYPRHGPHLEYERRRVQNVADLLGIQPVRSLPLGDFVMDFMVFDTAILAELRSRLHLMYGREPMLRILPKTCSNLEDKVEFGEWSLYAVFLLDVLGATPPIRNSGNRHVAQVHSTNDLEEFDFGARIVHVVDKRVDRNYLVGKLRELGLNETFRD